MKKQMTARLKAMGIHLCISAVLFISTALLLIYHYFPSVHFQINGGWQGLRLMFLIDIVLGPLITLLIYNPNKPKKEIRSDFCFVAAVQLAALIYGGRHIYQNHPHFLLLNPYGVVQSITEEQFAGDLSKVNFYNMPELTGLPLVSYNPAEKDNNEGLVLPAFYLESAKKSEDIVINSMPEDIKAVYEDIRRSHPDDILLRLVGSYKILWILVDEKWQKTALIGSEKII